MDQNQLRNLEQMAYDRAVGSGTVEDFEKVTNISKQIAEIEQAALEEGNRPKLVRYEALKTFATLIVPFLTVLTLAVTIYIQAAQLKATREANEDTEWREAVKNVLSQLNKPRSVVADPALAMSLLEPYTESGRHSRDASLLAIHLLSSVPAPDLFRDFFISHHLGEDPADIGLLTTVNRDLFSRFLELDQRLQQPSPEPILGPARDALIEDLKFLTQKMDSLYSAHPEDAGARDLRDAFLIGGDLSSVDLNGADLTGAKLQSMKLKDTSLGGKVKFDGAHFVDSHWWDAKEISRPLLEYLIANEYPYHDNEHVPYDISPPERAPYVEQITRLCKQVNLTCNSETIKYGEPPTTASSTTTK